VTRIRISPVTRLNGFWSVEVEVKDGQVVDARSSGIFFRGLELILMGRDPRDAGYLTERICGICSSAHATASALGLEDAFGLTVPANGVLLRNLIFGGDLLQNHLRHFYLMTLPDFVQGPDRPPFIPRYEADYRFTERESENLYQHYLEQLEMSRKSHEMTVLFGGKIPHTHGILAGGGTVPPDADKVRQFGAMLDQVSRFIEEKMVPDAYLLADRYPEYFEVGEGYRNLISYGMFQEPGTPGERVFKGGTVIDGQAGELDPDKITEQVTRSWYADDKPLHPARGRTIPAPGKEEGYSWVKAPRYNGLPFETGPLARLWLRGDYRRGYAAMDRLLARVLEARLVASLMKKWLAALDPGQPVFQSYELPDSGEGVGLTGAMRGALGHWFRMKGRRLTAYQVVTPSAWNLSPRDDGGQPGPVEKALLGTPIADPKNPIEIGRVIRSYDPCLACAAHIVFLQGEKRVFKI